jgi:hypothetical protein
VFNHALSLGGGTASALHWSLPTIISLLSFALSAIAVSVTLWDRRSQLFLQPRQGDWAKVQVTQTGKDVIFEGIIEVFNKSSRANVIKNYLFFCKRAQAWEKMESERYVSTTTGKTTVHNITPFPLPPHAGAEAHVMAFTKTPSTDMPIRIEIEDLYGKHYSVEVTATKKF